MATSFGTVNYEYDQAGRITAITDFKGNRITLSYDADGRSSGINYPQGGTTALTYNSLDQLTYLGDTRGRFCCVILILWEYILYY
jgi:YD repeat-containing protein